MEITYRIHRWFYKNIPAPSGMVSHYTAASMAASLGLLFNQLLTILGKVGANALQNSDKAV